MLQIPSTQSVIGVPTPDEVAPALLSLAAALVAALLAHWAVGRGRARFVKKLGLETASAGFETQMSLRRLLLEWAAKALRTVVWVLFIVLALNLLPQEKYRFMSARDNLLARLEYFGDLIVRQGVPAIVIIVSVIFLMRFAAALTRYGFQLFEQRVEGERADLVRRRARTLSAITRGVAQTVILFIGVLVLLQQVGISITPILASAGIVGIAVGFGAQSLVRDFFSGFLILLEEQYDVGDTVKIGEISGTIEHLTLRVTRLRGLDGSLTSIPNGSVTTVTNWSRDWTRAVLDLEIEFGEDPDRVLQLMKTVALELRAEWPVEIIDDPVLAGIEKIGAGSQTVRMTLKTAAGKQADVLRELRRRLRPVLEREHVRIPTTQPQLLLVSDPATHTSIRERT
ncbi:MAG: mechanosensitive ion channel family protein [Blastocatellia bacterium]